MLLRWFYDGSEILCLEICTILGKSIEGQRDYPPTKQSNLNPTRKAKKSLGHASYTNARFYFTIGLLGKNFLSEIVLILQKSRSANKSYCALDRDPER